MKLNSFMAEPLATIVLIQPTGCAHITFYACNIQFIKTTLMANRYNKIDIIPGITDLITQERA